MIFLKLSSCVSFQGFERTHKHALRHTRTARQRTVVNRYRTRRAILPTRRTGAKNGRQQRPPSNFCQSVRTMPVRTHRPFDTRPRNEIRVIKPRPYHTARYRRRGRSAKISPTDNRRVSSRDRYKRRTRTAQDGTAG